MAILDQLFGIQPQGQDTGGLVQSILSQRFQPSPDDVNLAMSQTATGRYTTPSMAMAARIAPGMDTATRLAQIEQQGAQTQGLNLQNQMTEFQLPFIQDQMRQLYGGMNPPVGFGGGQNNQPTQNSNLPPVGFGNQEDPRLREAHIAALLHNKELSDVDLARYNADPSVVERKSAAEKKGAQNVEDIVQARGTQDVVGLYNKLKTEATQAPSGVAENLWASATNAAGRPNEAAIAKGSYEADLNNLYLGMIRSLKGTGRVMQAELDELKNAQPKSADSMQVKLSKINAHMKYYTNRMTELGFDPATGRALGNNQLAPHNLSDVQPADTSSAAGGLDESDPRVQHARQEGYSDDEIIKYLMKGQP